MNKVILLGRIGKEIEMRYTPSGRAVTNFSVATSYRTGSGEGAKEYTEWSKIVTWGTLAENCKKFLDPGQRVLVEGRLQTRKWEDDKGSTHYSTEVVAGTVEFLEKSSKGSNGNGKSSAGSAREEEEPVSAGDAEDEFPF